MNKTCLVGRLTAQPELRYTNSNIAYSRFTIAINRPKQQDKEQETDFIDCVTWRGQAENLCNYQDKGNLIAIEGSIRKDSYDDKDGNKRYNTYVQVDRIQFLQQKSERTMTNEEIDNMVKPKDFEKDEDPFSDFGDRVSIDENFLD